MATTTTNASGYYEFPGLSDGNYVVTPTKAGVEFDPTSANVVVAGDNELVSNFVGTESLPLPYTYSLVTTEADGTAVQLADPLWQKYSAYAAPVVSSSVTDSAGVNCGASKVVKFVDNEVDQRTLFVFPAPLSAGITVLRLGVLKRAGWENQGANPWCTFTMQGGVAETGNFAYVSGTRSTSQNPNQAYLNTRYTLNGATQTEMNWASVTQVISTNVAAHKWVWNLIELNFTAQTVRFEARRYGFGTEYYIQQAMHANGIAAGTAPQLKAIGIQMTPAASNPGYFAKLWIGTGSDAWPT